MVEVYIRGWLGFEWMVTAIVSYMSGGIKMAVLYAIFGGAFWYWAYVGWKKEKNK